MLKWIKEAITRQPAGKISPVIPVATIHLPPMQERQTTELYQDQIMRKSWAEDVLRGAGIPVNEHLPCIEGGAETTLRTEQEIVERLIALTTVAAKGEGLEQEFVDRFVSAKKSIDFFSPKELQFIQDPNPDDHSKIQFAWKYECAWVMLHALNYFQGPMPYPSEICDVSQLVGIVRDVENLGRRGVQSVNNILNEADLIYRYHWAVRQASIDGVPPPGGLDAGVVMERHRALNWLIRYDNEDNWDCVGTDT